MSDNVKTYAGIPVENSDYANSKVVLLPVPFDATSTWGKGADKGPAAFLEASENMELYDIETDSEAYLAGVYLAPPPDICGSPEAMASKIKSLTHKFLDDDKLFTMIGGEHSVSIGAIMAAAESFDNISVLQLDAHADLRKSYLGSEYNHACALHWASKNTNLVQVGIRSMDISEKIYMNPENVFFAEKIQNLVNHQKKIADKLTKNVYITIDLDFFDPSIMPSTGTPVPGGLYWGETLSLLKLVSKTKNIVGFDIVELAPNENNKAPDFLAANLYYKILSYIFEQ